MRALDGGPEAELRADAGGPRQGRLNYAILSSDGRIVAAKAAASSAARVTGNASTFPSASLDSMTAFPAFGRIAVFP